MTVLYGKNGAGKTRLLRAIADTIGGAASGSSLAALHLTVPDDHVRGLASDSVDTEEVWKSPDRRTWTRRAVRAFQEDDMLSEYARRWIEAPVPDQEPLGAILVPNLDAPAGAGPGWGLIPAPRNWLRSDFQPWWHTDYEELEFAPPFEDTTGPLSWIEAGEAKGAIAWVAANHPPIRVIDLDNPVGLEGATLDALPPPFIGSKASRWALNEEFSDALLRIECRATELYQLLGPDPRPLRLRLPSPNEALAGVSGTWQVPSRMGTDVPLSALSFAQARWAHAAVLLALTEFDDRYTLIVADEPEAGLHRSIAAEQPAGIAEMLKQLGSRVEMLVTSHSPYLMTDGNARLLHVHRTPAGWSTMSETELDVSGGVETDRAIELLGLLQHDVLGLTRIFVFVEGPHDADVLRAYLGDVLTRNRARLVVLGGSKNATAVASDVYWSMSDAPLLVVFDQVNQERLEHWYAALDAYARGDVDAGDTALQALKAQASSKQWTEIQGLANLALAARSKGMDLQRIKVHGLSQPDIVCYLPVQNFIEDAESWADELAGVSTNPKKFIGQRRGYDITNDEVSLASERIRGMPPPPDLQELGQAIARLASPGGTEVR